MSIGTAIVASIATICITFAIVMGMCILAYYTKK